MSQRCEFCRFWELVDDEGSDGVSPKGDPFAVNGNCRRNAPKPVTRRKETIRKGSWPETCAIDWCGEFAALPCGGSHVSPERRVSSGLGDSWLEPRTYPLKSAP